MLFEPIEKESFPLERNGRGFFADFHQKFAVIEAEVLDRRVGLEIPEFNLAVVVADIEYSDGFHHIEGQVSSGNSESQFGIMGR